MADSAPTAAVRDYDSEDTDPDAEGAVAEADAMTPRRIAMTPHRPLTTAQADALTPDQADAMSLLGAAQALGERTRVVVRVG
jgi:hypothetical protein